ncbi:MAG: biotin transporter BioY [Kiloniellales bacterium]|nr:biotin transporter BioY [Kiloniellales bacterium]
MSLTHSAGLQGAQPTLASVLWPRRDAQRLLRPALLALLGSLLVAASAQVEVPLWPVPITGQTFAVLVIGMAYGARLGAATLALYFAQGAAGLPVFAGFAAGPAVLMGPTGGYLLGFVLAAGLIGYLAERGWDRGPLTTALAMLLGNIVIYLPGLAWLTVFLASAKALTMDAAFTVALSAGLTPFLLGDALKLALAAAALPLAWKLLAKGRGKAE